MVRIVIATLLAARPLTKVALILAALLPLLALPAQAEPLANACKGKTHAPQTLNVGQPLNLGQLKNQLYFYACSGAYDADLNKVTAAARAYVEQRAAQVAKPALVLDIDETSLSNVPRLFIAGLLDLLFSKSRIKVYVVALLIALGIGQQFYNANDFRRDWARQQEIFWQMAWRIPALKPGTVILTNELPLNYETDMGLTAPLNWMYAPDYTRGDLPYALLYTRTRLDGASLPALEPV